MNGYLVVEKWFADELEPAVISIEDPGITPWFDDSVEHLEASDWQDPSCFEFYSDSPRPDDVIVVEQPAAPELPDGILSETNDDFPDYWSQAPPIDDHFEAFSKVEDASNQPEYLEDQDQLGFDISPLADDNDVAASRSYDADEQLEDTDEDFGFAISIPDDPVLADPLPTEDSSDQLEDFDEDFGFSDAPRPDDNDVAVAISDDADTQLEDIDEDYGFSLSIPDDPVLTDPVPTEDSADQLEDVDEDYGFAVLPLADDNDVGIPASFPDQSEEPEPEDFGFNVNPLSDNFPITYTLSISGGIVFSGAPIIVHEKTYAVSGGLDFSGSPLQIKTNIYDITGNITFSGTSTIIFTPVGTTPQPRLPMTGAGIT